MFELRKPTIAANRLDLCRDTVGESPSKQWEVIYEACNRHRSTVGRVCRPLPLTLNQALAQIYLPDKFTHEVYPLIVPTDTSVPTIAVGDVMAVFAWPPRTERYKKVTRFVEAFFSKFDRFQQPPRHPKWREVNLTAEVPGWTRFQPAQDWLVSQTTTGTASTITQARCNTVLFQTNPTLNGNLTNAAKNALFRQFFVWDKQQEMAR